MSKIKTITEEAIRNIHKANESMISQANKKRLPSPFKVNDKVMLSTKNLSLEDGSGMRKLHPKYCGPFTITENINHVTFRLDLSQPMIERGIHNAFHASLLKPYVEDKFNRNNPPPPPEKFNDSEHEFYEIEKVLAKKKIRGKWHQLIKWKGYPDHDNSWEPIEHMRDLPS